MQQEYARHADNTHTHRRTGASQTASGTTGLAQAQALRQVLDLALADLDLVALHRPSIWLPPRNRLTDSLLVMLLRGMLGRLYWTFFSPDTPGESDGPDTGRIVLELAYTFSRSPAAATNEALLPDLASRMPFLLADVPPQAPFCPFVEWSPRWQRRNTTQAEQLRELERLPGLRWEECGLQLRRPVHAQPSGRADRGRVTVERQIYGQGWEAT